MLKGVLSSGTRVEELRREEAIWTLKYKVKWIADRTATEDLVGRTAQKQQQTWESDNTVRYGSHQSRSPQNRLRDEQTCGTTLALAYILHCLSAIWLQLQIIGRSLRWKWVLIDVLPLNTGDWVQQELSLSIIRLVNYSVTTSLIYKQIV